MRRGAGVLSPFVLRLSKPVLSVAERGERRTGSAEGRSPFAGGTGVSPVVGLISPFLARKGAGGMVETAVGCRRTGNGAEGLRQALSESEGPWFESLTTNGTGADRSRKRTEE